MKNLKCVIDTSSVLSFASIEKLDILNHFFSTICIPQAVWEELSQVTDSFLHSSIEAFFSNKVKTIQTQNDLFPFVDYGEAEAMILAREIKADFLIIDDKKAREIADQFNINCVGTLGVLARAKEKKLILKLRPLFIELLEKKRYYSKQVLNNLLNKYNEKII